jgi:membrane associated rhomboid family serine protease
LSYALTPVVKRLIIANVAVFFVGLAIDQRTFTDWLAFHPDHVFTQPWGVVTYMFVHGDFWHILLNMLVLFFFGPPLEALWGGREFTKFYFLCGLGGVALSFAFSDAGLIGASAAVYGLMLAFAMNWPTTPIYIWGIFPVQARWLVAFLFVVSLFSAFGSQGMGGGVSHLAHLGGLVTGFIYLKLDWRPAAKLDRLKRATRVRRLAIVPRDETEEEGQRDASPGSTWARVDERRLLDAVDRVLDKISAEGMSSLTSDERRLLDEVSRRHRTN